MERGAAHAAKKAHQKANTKAAAMKRSKQHVKLDKKFCTDFRKTTFDTPWFKRWSVPTDLQGSN